MTKPGITYTNQGLSLDARYDEMREGIDTHLYFEGLSGGVWLSSSRGDSSSDGVVQGGRISFSEKEAGDINGA